MALLKPPVDYGQFPERGKAGIYWSSSAGGPQGQPRSRLHKLRLPGGLFLGGGGRGLLFGGRPAASSPRGFEGEGLQVFAPDPADGAGGWLAHPKPALAFRQLLHLFIEAKG